MRDYIKLGLTLFLMCAIAAGLLAVINSATAPVIAQNIKEASYAKYYEALEAGDEIEEISAEELDNIQAKYSNITSVLTVNRGGAEFGKILTATSNGYGGAMENAIILDLEGNVIAYRNIYNDESPGFGNVISDESYYSKYDGKSVASNNELVLGSGGGANEVEAISGSTVTSRAVLAGLNDAIAAFKEFYAGK